MKTNELINLVKETSKAVLEERNLELWDVEFKKEGPYYYLRVYLDSENSVKIEDLEVMTRTLNKVLDEKDPVEKAYILEVTSVGIDKPLKFDRDFEKAIGKKIYVKLFSSKNGKKEYESVLTDYKNGILKLQAQDEAEEISKSEISSAHLIGEVSFK